MDAAEIAGHEVVALDEAVHGARRVDAQAAVAAVAVGLDQVDEAAEDLDVGPAQAAPVDVGCRDLGHDPGHRAAADDLAHQLALPGAEQLAVAQQRVTEARRQHHRRGHQRTRIRAAAHLVHATEAEAPRVLDPEGVAQVGGETEAGHRAALSLGRRRRWRGPAATPLLG